MSSPTHKTYVIRKANDLLSIPEDRLPIFLTELASGIAATKAAEKMLRDKVADPKTPWLLRFICNRVIRKGVLHEFRWVDDGQFTASFAFGGGQKMLLSRDWTKAGQP